MSNGTGKIGMNDMRDSVSEWKVCIPSDVDREVYIKNCYLTGTVSITNENGETVHNIKVGKVNLQAIDFPELVDGLGSDVICVKAPYSSRLYIVEVFYTTQQYLNQSEDQYRFLKSNGAGTAGILIDGKGNIILTVDGDENSGNVKLNVSNKERKGKLDINVNGDIAIVNDGNTSIKTTTQINVEFNNGNDEKKSTVNLSENGVLVTSNKIQLNESDEPILLGQKTVDLISSILDQLSKESAGIYPLIGQPIYEQIKEKIDELKSTKSFVG